MYLLKRRACQRLTPKVVNGPFVFYLQTRRITAIPKAENAPRENRGMFDLVQEVFRQVEEGFIPA